MIIWEAIKNNIELHLLQYVDHDKRKITFYVTECETVDKPFKNGKYLEYPFVTFSEACEKFDELQKKYNMIGDNQNEH